MSDPVTLGPPLDPAKVKRLARAIWKLPASVRVEYHNDVGPNDDGFWEWFRVGDDADLVIKVSDCDPASQAAAEFIAAMINCKTEVLAALELAIGKD